MNGKTWAPAAAARIVSGQNNRLPRCIVSCSTDHVEGVGDVRAAVGASDLEVHEVGLLGLEELAVTAGKQLEGDFHNRHRRVVLVFALEHAEGDGLVEELLARVLQALDGNSALGHALSAAHDAHVERGRLNAGLVEREREALLKHRLRHQAGSRGVADLVAVARHGQGQRNDGVGREGADLAHPDIEDDGVLGEECLAVGRDRHGHARRVKVLGREGRVCVAHAACELFVLVLGREFI